MFEVTGTDIANLSDADLRTLVARLALSELRAQGAPLSSVTAGGHQDAPDGGLDVRVECALELENPDFVPRRLTGFQVKKPDMNASAIRKEMRPKGKLRPIFASLAAGSGAYIIVCSQGSVADQPLMDRRAAIRTQLLDLDGRENLHIDFYDRDRVANWANEFPGVVAWVRGRLGLRFDGWSSIGDWIGTKVETPAPFLVDEKACLTDETSSEQVQLTINEGISKLRQVINEPKSCVRLIGLSGLGKTRFVQALFESNVGEFPLDPSLCVYTDYSVETDPTARDMARQLVVSGKRAILVVDNCNPATHGDLVQICSSDSSNVSLLTVEYDVGDDEPERTEVYRLQSASPDLVSKWLGQCFPDISQVDRGTLADFSDGNFRVARAIAETIKRGETLGKLRSRDLFERIFQQRNGPDQQLLHAAEDLSLLYSVDGEDISGEAELAQLAGIRVVSASDLYAALVELRRRGIAQARGRWRAVLPHAIANALASYALQRIHPEKFDQFCASLNSRMLRSLSRRLGYLHDSPEARRAVGRWLQADGPISDLFSLNKEGLQLLTNIAPVVPQDVLLRLERELDGPNGPEVLSLRSSTRSQWILLIKVLCYDMSMFDRATLLLARFAAVEPKGNNRSSGRGLFTELFHLYLSGTEAPPEQRFGVVRRLAYSSDPQIRQCASIALDGLLEVGPFSSSSRFDFGARPRDWGWKPTLNRDVWDWYTKGIELVMELSPTLVDGRTLLAKRVRELWRIDSCQEAIENAATMFSQEEPWIEGWLGLRVARQYDSKSMQPEELARLDAFINRLKPTDLFHQACVVVLNGGSAGWDIVDGELEEVDGDLLKPWEKASHMAVDIGRSLAADSATRERFLTRLFAERNQPRAAECGRGLAEGTKDLPKMWREVVKHFLAIDPKSRNPNLLGGFVHRAKQLDPTFAFRVIDAVGDDPDLQAYLPYLQAHVGMDSEGILRLVRATQRGFLGASDFLCIANGAVCGSPSTELGVLLLAIADLRDGVEVALDILLMHVYDLKDSSEWGSTLINVGRELLCRADFSKRETLRDLTLEIIVRACCLGEEGMPTAKVVCVNLRSALEAMTLSTYDLDRFFTAIFETQPHIALDMFLSSDESREFGLFDTHFGLGGPVEKLSITTLREWAHIDAQARYSLLGRAIIMFKRQEHDEGHELSPLFLQLLEFAPDKLAFLGSPWGRAHPRGGWSGSLAETLDQRRPQFVLLSSHSDAVVRQWALESLPQMDQWIEAERIRERRREESFE